MNPNTIELLETFNSEIKILEISGKKINGELNLNKFAFLEELDCNFNSINTITKLPNTITRLNCSLNKLTSLENLLKECVNLKFLNFSFTISLIASLSVVI